MVAMCTITFGGTEVRDDRMTTDICAPMTVLYERIKIRTWMGKGQAKLLQLTSSICIQTARTPDIGVPYPS